MQLQTFLKKGDLTQAELARRLKVTPGLVWQWLNGHRRIAAERVLSIENATDGKVTRHDLRPDLYPRDAA
jgi:DNA-binding transcriptional regulator YdaS (Cro superfamily)